MNGHAHQERVGGMGEEQWPSRKESDEKGGKGSWADRYAFYSHGLSALLPVST